MVFLSSVCSNNNIIIEELENIIEFSNFSLKEIIKVHKEITIQHSMKVPSVSGVSQSKNSFINYLLCYTAKISLKIEYIENNSLLLLPIDFFYTAHIPLKNKFETIHLNPKINRFIIEKLEQGNLYVYINFSPYEFTRK